MTFAASTDFFAEDRNASIPSSSVRVPEMYPVMDPISAPVAARASRSLFVQSHISTCRPRSAIRSTRSMNGRSV